MHRFSIRTLMAVIIVPAVGLAALRNADDVWAGAMLLTTLAAVGVAVLGVVIMRDRERFWWLGFALFCGGYLTLTFAPGFSFEVRPRLLTTRVLGIVHPMAASAQSTIPQILWQQHAQVVEQLDRLKAANRGPGDQSFDSLTRMLANLRTQLPGAANYDEFIRVGHSIFALLAGLIGGTVAIGFHARRERIEGAAGMPARAAGFPESRDSA